MTSHNFNLDQYLGWDWPNFCRVEYTDVCLYTTYWCLLPLLMRCPTTAPRPLRGDQFSSVSDSILTCTWRPLLCCIALQRYCQKVVVVDAVPSCLDGVKHILNLPFSCCMYVSYSHQNPFTPPSWGPVQLCCTYVFQEFLTDSCSTQGSQCDQIDFFQTPSILAQNVKKRQG